MQTKPKSNSVITHALGEDGVLTFNVIGAGTFPFDISKVSQANRDRAARHGFIQRLTDAAAIGRDKATGASAPPSVKLAAMQRLAEFYMAGGDDWSPAREAGGGPGLDGVILAAVAEATGKTLEEVRVMVAEGAGRKAITPKAYLAALGTAKLVAPIVARIRGKDAGVSGDDLLEEAMTEPEEEGDGEPSDKSTDPKE